MSYVFTFCRTLEMLLKSRQMVSNGVKSSANCSSDIGLRYIFKNRYQLWIDVVLKQNGYFFNLFNC